jgi:hypothetical protein
LNLRPLSWAAFFQRAFMCSAGRTVRACGCVLELSGKRLENGQSPAADNGRDSRICRCRDGRRTSKTGQLPGARHEKPADEPRQRACAVRQSVCRCRLRLGLLGLECGLCLGSLGAST